MTVLFGNAPARKEKLSIEYILKTQSPLPFTATVRKTLAEWFTHYPQEQKKEFLSRLRKDDASHSGALLELATHEILRRCAGRVSVEDVIPSGNRPDFHLCTSEGKHIWVECTVAQRSGEFSGAIATARRLREIVNSMDTRPFGLSWMLLGYSRESDPRESRLKKGIEQFVLDLSGRDVCRPDQKGRIVGSFVWADRGWRIRFEAIYLPGRDRNARSIVVDEGENAGVNDASEGWMGNDIQKLRSTLEHKADQLKSAYGSCVIVISHSDLILDNTGDVFAGALFAHPATYGEHRPFYGSIDRPSHQHISGVLYIPWVKAYMFCTSEPPWFFVPHPWSKSPLEHEIFPFAERGSLNTEGKFKWDAPLYTPNEYLGLPDNWPGNPEPAC